MASVIHCPAAHGLSSGDAIRFANVEPGTTGLDPAAIYYVVAAGLTSTDFEFSDSLGGTPITLTEDVTSATVALWDTYTPVVDGVMDPPDPVATPTGLAWTSTSVLNSDGSSSVRIDISLNVPADAKTRQTAVTLTGGGNPMLVVFNPEQTTASVENVLGATSYTAVAVAYDVYGNASAATASVTHTTAADTTAPDVPTGLSVLGLINSVVAEWTPVTALDLAYYEVAVSSDGGSTYPLVFRGHTDAFAVGALAAGTYYIKVRAVDRSGNASAYCTAVSGVARLASATDIADGAVTLAKFASTVRPVTLVTALPSLPDATYPVGSFVYKTTDSPARLYKNVADAWVAGIGPNDIQADSITAGQIAAGAIGTTELAVGAQLTGQLANETGLTPGVFIDSTGILIRAGKLTLQDEFGATSLTTTGFTGTWADFIATGLYNGILAAGVAGTIANGRTAALPYWTVSDLSAGATLTFQNPGLRYTFAGVGNKKRIVSDVIKIADFEDLEFGIGLTAHVVGATQQLKVTIGVATNTKADFTGSSASGTHDSTNQTFTVGDTGPVILRIATTPGNGPYARITVDVEELVHHDAGAYVDVGKVFLLERGQQVSVFSASDYLEGPGFIANNAVDPIFALIGNESISGTLTASGPVVSSRSATTSTAFQAQVAGDTNPRLVVRGDGLLKWSDGTNPIDLVLRRSAAKTLVIDADGAGGAVTLFKVFGPAEVTGTLSADSTRHGMTVHSFKGTIASGTATLTLDPMAGAVGGNGIIMPWAGRVVAVAIRVASARTAGTAIAHATINGSNTSSPNPQLDGTNTSALSQVKTYANGKTFSAGDSLRAEVVTSSWTPTSNIVQVDVYVLYDAVA